MNIIFLCHGNICRSVMAEYIFKDILEKNGLLDKFNVVSRATSREEIGNDIYPKSKEVLKKNNIKFDRHYAKQITYEEYLNADYVLAMEEFNIDNLKWIIRSVDRNKVLLLRNWSKGNKEISDPWYSGCFEQAYNEIYEGCIDFLKNVVFN